MRAQKREIKKPRKRGLSCKKKNERLEFLPSLACGSNARHQTWPDANRCARDFEKEKKRRKTGWSWLRIITGGAGQAMAPPVAKPCLSPSLSKTPGETVGFSVAAPPFGTGRRTALLELDQGGLRASQPSVVWSNLRPVKGAASKPAADQQSCSTEPPSVVAQWLSAWTHRCRRRSRPQDSWEKTTRHGFFGPSLPRGS